MLKLIEGSYASRFPRDMDAMFRNRAEIFGKRLGLGGRGEGRVRAGPV